MVLQTIIRPRVLPLDHYYRMEAQPRQKNFFDSLRDS